MESESEFSESKKPVKEVPVVLDQGFFTHSTDDTYDGYFEARKKDRSLRMQGPGTYTTAEGDVYKGMWENDRLGVAEDVIISYQDGTRYEGGLKDWCYSGPAHYYDRDSSVYSCNFVENCPIANMRLQDPNNHTWLAKAETGFAWFYPVNHFYELLAERSRENERPSRTRSTASKSKQQSTATSRF